MVNIFVGLFFVFITVPFWVTLIETKAYFVLLFVGIFDVVGIWLFYKGFSKLVRDIRTRKNGVETYAQLMNIFPSGTYVNDVPELKGTFKVFNPDTYQTDNVDEILGVGAFKYHEGQVVKVKYYNGDINILNITDINEVPGDISKYFTYSSPTSIESQLSNVTNPADEIEIDGVKYKKVD